MNIKLLLLAAMLGLTACVTTPLPPENGPDHPVQLPPPTVPDSPLYNPHLLVPHRDPKTKLWGYIDRTTRKEVIPHMFTFAERVQRDYGLAMVYHKDIRVEDVYRITPDGKYKLLHKGKKEHGGVHWEYQNRRLGDDYFFMRSGKYYALFDPDGNRLWDTLAPLNLFVTAGSNLGYLGQGHMAMLNGSHFEIKDRKFETIAKFDTTQYAIVVPDYEVWERVRYRQPPIMILDLKNKKVGFMDVHGKMLIPFDYDFWPGIEIKDVQHIYWGNRVKSFLYVPNQYGQMVVQIDGRNCLINEQNELLYRCSDSTGFGIDPHYSYNPVENTIMPVVWGIHGINLVIDLDTDSLILQNESIMKFGNAAYLLKSGTYGLDPKAPKRLVDVKGNPLPSDFDKYDNSILHSWPDQGGGEMIWYVYYEGKKGIVNTTGKFVVDIKYDAAELYSANRAFQYAELYNRGEYSLNTSYLFLADGTQIAGPIRFESSGPTNSHFFTNLDWRFETVENALFFYSNKKEKPYYQGYVDAYGHSFIDLE